MTLPEEATSGLSQKSGIASEHDEIIHTAKPTVPDMTTSLLNLRSQSIFEPHQDAKTDETVFNQLLSDPSQSREGASVFSNRK